MAEEGTEAAAATAVTYCEYSARAPPPTPTIRIQRPFLYALVDDPQNEVEEEERERNAQRSCCDRAAEQCCLFLFPSIRDTMAAMRELMLSLCEPSFFFIGQHP